MTAISPAAGAAAQRSRRRTGTWSRPSRFAEGTTPTSHWFFLGAGLALWTTWQVSSALGIFLGASIPPSWPLAFALPLIFIGMVVPVIKDKPLAASALSAAAVALLANNLPYRLGLILAAFVGLFVGMILESRK